MTTKFTVSNISEDEDTRTRKCTVRVGTSGDVKFQTPIRVGVDNATDIPVYEAYRRIKPSTINNCIKNESYDRKTGLDISKRCLGNFNILTIEYDSKDEKPNERMIQAISDLQYYHTDAIVTPSWFELVTKDDIVDLKLFKSLSASFIEASSIRNHKPIIGMIPQSISPLDLDKVIKFYVDQDVTSFMIDSHGRTLISGMWMRTLQRSMDQYNLDNEGILYSMNSFQGAVHKNEEDIEAKDFVGFAAGIDFLGWKHTSKYYGSATDESQMTVGRQFDPSTYNYKKIPCTLEEKKFITSESIRCQNKELVNVRTAVDEHCLLRLLGQKKLSKETISQLKSCKKEKSCTLDNFI